MPSLTSYEVAGASPTRCPKCGSTASDPTMSVTEIVATDIGLKAHGTGTIGCFCPTCGQFLEAATEAFAVECAGVACPRCKGKDVACRLESVRRAGKEFAFDGVVVCADCGHRGVWKKLVAAVGNIKRLKLAAGPSGVEVEVEKG